MNFKASIATLLYRWKHLPLHRRWWLCSMVVATATLVSSANLESDDVLAVLFLRIVVASCLALSAYAFWHSEQIPLYWRILGLGVPGVIASFVLSAWARDQRFISKATNTRIIVFDLCVLGGLVIYLLIAWRKAHPQHPWDPFVRGRPRSHFKSDPAPGYDESLIEWGGQLISLAETTLMFLIIGAIGAGKTTLAKLLIQRVLVRASRSICYDPKTEFVSFLSGSGVNVKLLNVYDERGAAWKLSNDITDEDTALEVARNFIPKNDNDKSDPIWSSGPQQLLAGVFLGLHERAPEQWTFRDVLLIALDREICRLFLSLSPQNRHLAKAYFADKRTSQNIHTTLVNRLQPFKGIAAAWAHSERRGNAVSLAEWASSKDGTCLVLGENLAKQATLQPLNQVLLERVSNLLLAPGQPAPEPSALETFCLFDELSLAPTLCKPVERLVTAGRSFSLSCALLTQDLPGLFAHLGEHTAKSLVAKPHWKVFLRTECEFTQKWMSEQLGKVQYWQDSVTDGPTGESWTQKMVIEDFALPNEFQFEPTTPENGIHGLYMGPRDYGHWEHILSFHRWPPLRLSGEPDFVPRPAHEFVLAPWTVDDLTRLNLPTDEDILELLGVELGSPQLRLRRPQMDPVEVNE